MTFIHKYTKNSEGKLLDGGIWLYDNGVCYNRKGGHHDYTPTNLDEIFEADSWAAIIKQEMLAKRNDYVTGWIAPSGEFFGCDAQDHYDMARYVLGADTETELEDCGWIKVYEVPWRLRAISSYERKPYGYFGRPTLAQEETLKKLGVDI